MSVRDWDRPVALQNGLTANFIYESDDHVGRAHLMLAGFDDLGRPFSIDLMGWPGRRGDADETPLNRLMGLIDKRMYPDDECPICGRSEPTAPTQPDALHAPASQEQEGDG